MKKRTAALLATLALVAVGLVAGASLATGRTANDAGEPTGRVPQADGGTDTEADAESSASDDDGTEHPITGADLERASQVALDHLGQGRVTDTEVEDEESYYEVEVTLDDGRQVDVQLDEEFNVVSDTTDAEGDD